MRNEAPLLSALERWDEMYFTIACEWLKQSVMPNFPIDSNCYLFPHQLTVD
jgi:hypothetical protein